MKGFKGYFYIVILGRIGKVGFTKSLERRLRQLLNQHKIKPELIYCKTFNRRYKAENLERKIKLNMIHENIVYKGHEYFLAKNQRILESYLDNNK